MTVSILGLHCLNAVTDDYENVASIMDEVRRTSHGNVSREEVVAEITEMLGEGLVAAFRFEPQTSRFTLANPELDRLDTLWFQVTLAGRHELDANWVDA